MEAIDIGGFEPQLGRSVSIDQAAQLMKVSRRTIYNRIREGRLQTIRTRGGSQRVLLSSLYDLGLSPQTSIVPSVSEVADISGRPTA